MIPEQLYQPYSFEQKPLETIIHHNAAGLTRI
jgi:hypothetical protein